MIRTTFWALTGAITGVGVALGRTSMVEPELKSGRLVAPFTLAVQVQEGFHLVSRENAQNARQAAVFREWVLRAAGK